MKKAKWVALLLVLALCVGMLAGCGGAGDGRRIIRIGHNQATTHPTHIGLEAFAEFINTHEVLGDKYEIGRASCRERV